MNSAHDLHVVLGARGGVGQAVVRLLAGHGQRVRAISRGHARVPDGVDTLTADLLQREQAERACRGAAIVYHCAGVPYPQWAAALPVMMENIIAGPARRARAWCCIWQD